MAEKRSLKTNKDMIVRALTDPAFRKRLAANPAQALGKKRPLSPVQMTEVKLVLATVRSIDRQIGAIADELLCANGGGGCGIA